MLSDTANVLNALAKPATWPWPVGPAPQRFFIAEGFPEDGFYGTVLLCAGWDYDTVINPLGWQGDYSEGVCFQEWVVGTAAPKKSYYHVYLRSTLIQNETWLAEGKRQYGYMATTKEVSMWIGEYGFVPFVVAGQ